MVEKYFLLFYYLSYLCLAQRAPCYQCQIYKENHPNSTNYNQIEGHCVYPCECPTIPTCPIGVPLERDGCGCCWHCARQEGEDCNRVVLCDASKGLACAYTHVSEAKGVCQVVVAARCKVNNSTFDDGETFLLDCRTQCTCKNGTYGCVSLCPGESIAPSSKCKNPHLTSVEGQCCREWVCEAESESYPKKCDRRVGVWSSCSSSECGVGLSHRWKISQPTCNPQNETRLCQIRPCESTLLDKQVALHLENHQHLRRGHTCKATQRYHRAVRLKVGSCISQKKYKPKLCGTCKNRCCRVYTATTITVAFYCPLHAVSPLLSSGKQVVKPHFGMEYQYISDNRDIPVSYSAYDLFEMKEGLFNDQNKFDDNVNQFMHEEDGPEINEYINHQSVKPVVNTNLDFNGINYPQEIDIFSQNQNDKKINQNIIESIHQNKISNNNSKNGIPSNPFLSVMDEGQPIKRNEIIHSESSYSPIFPIYQNNKRKKRSLPEYKKEKFNLKTNFENTNKDLFLFENFDNILEMEFNQLQNDNYEVVNQKVQWIIRCHCTQGNC